MMTSALNVPLSEETLKELRRLAGAQRTTPEELVRSCVEEWLRRDGGDFIAAAEYVLQKNAELYRRLS